MKKIISLIILLSGIIFISCNPLDDTYDEIDEANGPYNEQREYALVDADYILIGNIAFANAQTEEEEIIANNIKNNHFFTNEGLAADYIPNYLGDVYTALKKGSEFEITYKYSFDDSLSNKTRVKLNKTFFC